MAFELKGHMPPASVMFYIHEVSIGENFDLWQSLEATAYGIFYLQCKG